MHPKFKMIRDTRKNYAEKPLHPDTELHILAFDVIFCSTVYNLFEGIHYSVRNAEEKRIHLEKMDEARNARANHAEALECMAKLDYAEAFFAEKLSVGSAVTHKRFGVGTIIRSPACLAKSSKRNSPDLITPQRSYGVIASRQDCFPSKRLRMLPSTTSWSHCSVKRR